MQLQNPEYFLMKSIRLSKYAGRTRGARGTARF